MDAPRVNGRVHTGITAWYPRRKRVEVILRDRDNAAVMDKSGVDWKVKKMTFAYSSFDPTWKPGHGPAGADCEFCAPWREL
jgi:hypothetical protein